MAARGFIEVDIERCKGCELCVSACPPKIKCLKLNDSTNDKGYFFSVQFDETCIACQGCAIVCPDSCITVYKIKK